MAASKESLRTKSSRYTGVRWIKYHAIGGGGQLNAGKNWEAFIFPKHGQFEHIGYYEKEREAALAYDRRAIQLGKPTNILKPQKR